MLHGRAILIKTATVAYNQCPDFPVMAPGQRSMEERIEFEIRHIQSPLRRALEAEELCDEWGKNEEVKAKL